MDSIWLSSLQEHLRAGHISRRDFVKRASALGLSIPVVSAALAACGGDDDDDDDDDTTGAATQPAAAAATPTSSGVTVQQNVTPTPASSTAASPEATTAAAPTAPTGPSGGSVVFARAVDSDRLDPVETDANVDIWIFMSIYDQLIGVDDVGTGLVPNLAESWEVSEDGLNYTFNLRSGVKFQDGSDMTMDDIVWSLTRARDSETSPWTFTLAQAQEITAPDDATIQVVMSQKWAPFLSDISMFNASVISQAFAEEVGVEALVDQCMGTGPFGLQEWRRAEYTHLVRNEYFWREGLPLLDEIRFNVVPDSNAELLQVQGGDIDGVVGQGDVPNNRVADLQQDANLQVLVSLSTWNNFVVLQTKHEPLDDVHVRRALNYATDKQALIDTVLFGIGEVSNSFMPIGALYHNADQPGFPYDVAQAQEELAQSKVPDGFTLKFDIDSALAEQAQIAQALKDMWAQINVTLEIQPLESTVHRDNYRANNFFARLSGWTNDIIDPDELVSYAILPEATENYHTQWTSEEAISLAEQGRAELDDAKRREIYYQIQQIHMDEAPFVYLYVKPYVDVLRNRVKGFFHHPMGQYVLYNMYVEE